MDTNLVITLGLLVAVLAVPAFVRQWANGRRPILPLLSLLIGGGAVAMAILNHPGGFGLADLPDAVMEVIARLL
jgi:hypothetical protein